MALWGNKDSKTASGTVVVFSDGGVSGTDTSFTTEAKVGNTLRVSNKDYVIVDIVNDTTLIVKSGIDGGSITQVDQPTSYTLSEKPVYVAVAESHDNGYGSAGDSTKVYGVDAGEAEVTGKAHAGWVRRTVGTGGRAGRVFYETLVAGGSISGDQEDDSQFPDLEVYIDTQPLDASVVSPSSHVFTVEASTNSTQVLKYQWQVSSDNGSSFSDIEGATASSYEVVDSTDLNGTQYKVVVTTANGLATATSEAATLTVTTE